MKEDFSKLLNFREPANLIGIPDGNIRRISGSPTLILTPEPVWHSFLFLSIWFHKKDFLLQKMFLFLDF
jgi:hypothetical protein